MKKHLCLILTLLFITSLAFSAPIRKQWDKRFGGTDEDRSSSIEQTSDGGYILGGYSESTAGGDKTEGSRGSTDYWAVKIDSTGNKQWDKRFGGTDADNGRVIRQTLDGGYIFAGLSDSDAGGDKSEASRGDADYWVVKMDSAGSNQWDRRFGGTLDDYCHDIQQTSDGGYILAGTSLSDAGGDKSEASRGNADYWAVKIDSAGSNQWDRRFGGTNNDFCSKVQQTLDGGYILAGTSYSDAGGDKSEGSRGSRDYWIVKIDSAGSNQWDRRFGGTGGDNCEAICQTLDGGYILAGTSLSDADGDKSEESRGNRDYWIVKIDSAGSNQWDRRFGGTGADFCEAICQTLDGGYILAGNSSSGANGDRTEESRGGGDDYWIIKIDSAGNKLWDKAFGGTGADYCFDIQQAAENIFVLAGSSSSPAGLDKSEESRGNLDFWILKTCNQYTINDFDGDGTSDLTVFDNINGYWYIKTVDGQLITWENQWGWNGAVAAAGDCDGDGRSDMIAYDNVNDFCYSKSLQGNVPIIWREKIGGTDSTLVPGDYDGDGVHNIALFDNSSGFWFWKNGVNFFGIQWGWNGAVAVPGDYDGDYVNDYAVFDDINGLWYIRTFAGAIPVWENQWGWNGAIPVPGDYDGDGIFDLALFDNINGYWYIKTVDGQLITWANQWGWNGAIPVGGN